MYLLLVDSTPTWDHRECLEYLGILSIIVYTKYKDVIEDFTVLSHYRWGQKYKKNIKSNKHDRILDLKSHEPGLATGLVLLDTIYFPAHHKKNLSEET